MICRQKAGYQINKKDIVNVKRIACQLLETLTKENLVLDWKKKQQAKVSVQLTIEKISDLLPQVYSQSIYDQKCDLVYKYVYDFESPLYSL